MKKRFTEEQIVRILKEASLGRVGEVCRQHGVSETTYYKWRDKYRDMAVSDVRKLKSLEDENRRLKKILGEKELDIDALKALLEKYGEAR